MDLVAFFEAYSESLFALGGVCIGTLASFITLVAGYFFQKWNDERKRKWELDDREFNRKISAKDDRLQEAQAYLDAYKEACLQLLSLETYLLISSETESSDVVSESNKQFENIRKKTNFTTKRLLSIGFLNDPELLELNNKLIESYHNEVYSAFELRSRVHSHADIDKDAVRQRTSIFNNVTALILSRMQQILDGLAKTVK